MEYNLQRLLTVLIKLKDKDGKELPVNQGTIEDLSMSDGQLLETKVNEILDDSKKK